jgi:hypothetical protein
LSWRNLAGTILITAGLIIEPAHSAETVELSGIVEAGQSFTAQLPKGLVLELQATKDAPPGWTIVIHPTDDGETDVVWPANEPYRGDNVRYVATSYGKSPAEVLAWNPRKFLFYTNPAAAAAAVEWIKAQLWPNDYATPPDPPAPDGHGELVILDARTGSFAGEPAVTWMKFRFRLWLPPE